MDGTTGHVQQNTPDSKTNITCCLSYAESRFKQEEEEEEDDNNMNINKRSGKGKKGGREHD
jgi:hypothetical protein